MKARGEGSARRKRASAWASLAVAVSALGCGKILGVDGFSVAPSPRSDGGGSSKAFKFVDPTCGTCMQSSCNKELVACRNDVDGLCGPWQDCMAKCKPGDGACENVCFTKVGSTNGPMGEVAVCGLEHCLVECQASGMNSAKGPSCASAVRSNCGNAAADGGAGAWAAYAKDSRSLDWTRCLFEADCALLQKQNPNCTWGCADANGLYEPGSKAMALSTCVWGQAQAAQDCGFGNLSCKGKYSWRLSSDQPHVTVFAHAGFVPEAPSAVAPNVNVRACYGAVTGCSPPLATGTTGADGRADIVLPGSKFYSFEIEPGTLRPPWPNGPKIMRFEPGRVFHGGEFVSLPMNPSNWQDLSANPATGGVWDPTKAAILVTARDCEDGPIRGATFELDVQSGTTVKYEGFNGFSPTPGPGTFIAYFFGVEPGLRTVSAKVRGEKIAELKIVATADSFTTVDWLEPLTSDQIGD